MTYFQQLSYITTDIQEKLGAMEGEEFSAPESPSAEAISEDALYDNQLASLKTYVESVPYECESVEEMHAKLEYIVGKIFVCAEAKNWLVLTTWDGLLQWYACTGMHILIAHISTSNSWLLMRYPMRKPTRAKLVKLYYELCVLPGIEARVTRSWADMLTRLLDNKPGARRKLEAEDLQLDWRLVWRVLQKELWPKRRAQESSRNVVNIMLYVAEHCQRYYPSSEIPAMLEEFIPLVTQDVRQH
jgi:proteasome activator subunit 4